MKWFRANIKQGTRLALLALAIQFALSFGHFHPIEAAQAAPEFLQSASSWPGGAESNVVAVNGSAERQQKPASDHGSGQTSDGCAICAVIAMANTVLFATPPLLLLPDAIDFFYRATDTGFVQLNSVHLAFQPRAPPIS